MLTQEQIQEWVDEQMKTAPPRDDAWWDRVVFIYLVGKTSDRGEGDAA